MSNQPPMSPEPCEHHWIHYGQPSHSPIRWIVKCSQCNQFRIADLQEQVAAIVAAAEQRGAVKALREARSEWFQYADAINDTPSKYYPALWLKNRADQMEGDVANQGDWCHAEHCPYRGTGKMPTHRRHEHCPVWRTNA